MITQVGFALGGEGHAEKRGRKKKMKIKMFF